MHDAVTARRGEINELCSRFFVKRLELFGSAASGASQAAHRDLDFLVDFRPEAEPAIADHFFGLLAALRDLFGCPIDLVMRRAIRNPYFRQSVEQTKVLLYAA